MRHLLLITALTLVGLVPADNPAGASTAAASAPVTTVSTFAAQPDAVSASASMDSALRAALRAEFPTHAVRIRLGSPTATGASPEQREIQVHGRLLLDTSENWVGFNLTALYDVSQASATATTIAFDAPAVAEDQADPALTQRLAVESSRRLQEEFANQPARIDIERIQVRPAGVYLALLADGHADFGPDGRAAATVRALYDPAQDRWLRVDYELGDGNTGS